jgi:hypothetical protein
MGFSSASVHTHAFPAQALRQAGRRRVARGRRAGRQGRPHRHPIASALRHMPRGRPRASARATARSGLRLTPSTRRSARGPIPPLHHELAPAHGWEGWPVFYTPSHRAMMAGWLFPTPFLMRSCRRRIPLHQASGKSPPPQLCRTGKKRPQDVVARNHHRPTPNARHRQQHLNLRAADRCLPGSRLPYLAAIVLRTGLCGSA